MGDFTQKSVTKTAERILATPISDMTGFQSIIASVLSDNPWGCTDFEESGVTVNGVRKGTEYYSGKVNYQNTEAKVIGSITVKAPTSTGFGTSVSTVLGDADLATAMGGTASHDSSEDSYSCILRCHASNGEQYTVTMKRDKITIGSYEDDSIVSTIETWADGITALA